MPADLDLLLPRCLIVNIDIKIQPRISCFLGSFTNRHTYCSGDNNDPQLVTPQLIFCKTLTLRLLPWEIPLKKQLIQKMAAGLTERESHPLECQVSSCCTDPQFTPWAQLKIVAITFKALYDTMLHYIRATLSEMNLPI